MKKAATFFLLLLSFNLIAQNSTSQTLNKLAPRLQLILQDRNTLNKSSELLNNNFIPSDNGLLQIVVKTSNVSELKSLGYDVNSTFKDLATLRTKPEELFNLASLNSVESVSSGHLFYPANDVASAVVGAKLLNSGYVNNTEYTGKGVLLCIIDTGIDWKHLDFRDLQDTTKSRIIYIWDQTISKIGSEKTPQDRDAVNFAGLNYGVEYSTLDINNEIDGSPSGFVRETDTNGHGTHVAGTATGNGGSMQNLKYAGVAPDADILVVKAGNGSFSTNNIIDAITYANKVAIQLQKPVVINMSLGSDGGPHDGTTPEEIAVDNFVTSGSGRVCVISAGNSGNSKIHITGSIPNSNSVNFSITVPTYTPQSGSNNDHFDFDLWFDNSGTVSTFVSTPTSIKVNSTTNTLDGYVYIGNFVNGLNNNRELEYYIYDQISAQNPKSGNWNINVTNTSGSTMVYHGWLNSNTVNATLLNGNSNMTVGSPGTATNALTVGSFISKWRWQSINGGNYGYTGTDLSDNISSFSSIGPRRDGLQKPDISAPGQAIVSARSSSTTPDSSWLISGGKYLIEQGTSMASPVTAGSIALLFQQNPDLTYSEVKDLITSNSTTDSYTGSVPNNNWGYGKLNIFSAMVDLVNPSWERNFKTFVYDQWATNQYTNVSPNQRFAIKFTPDFSGQIVGTFIHTFTSNGITSPLSFEVWNDNSGLPSSKIGNTVNYNASNLALYAWNYIDLREIGANLNSGTNYYLVAYFTSGTPTGILIDAGNVDSRTFRDYNDGNGWVVKTYDMRMRPVMATDKSLLLSVNSNEQVPIEFSLFNNYPNPFNPETMIKYQLPKASFVKLKIYDILGREVQTLVNTEQNPGVYQVQLNGNSLSSGVYFYRIEAGNFVETKKMILLK